MLPYRWKEKKTSKGPLTEIAFSTSGVNPLLPRVIGIGNTKQSYPAF